MQLRVDVRMSTSIPKSCYGTYELALHEHFHRCEKNPDHNQFIPAKTFNTNHLREDYNDKDIIEFTQAASDLTLRVVVKFTSCNRPKFWPNRNDSYPFYNFKGKDVLRSGTGRVCDVKMHNAQLKKRTCQCLKCRHSDSPSNVFGKITVLTALHVVFDDEEANDTTCRLFFDDHDSPCVNLHEFTTKQRDVDKDKCLMTCETCDVDLLDKLDKSMHHFTDLSLKVNEKYKSNRDDFKIAIIISHPHGLPKHVTVGTWIDKSDINENGETIFTYTTCTCPGSSGATVYFIGYHVAYDSCHLHSGVNSNGSNISTIGKIVDSTCSAPTDQKNAKEDLKLCLVRGNKEIFSVQIPEDQSKVSVIYGDLKLEIKKILFNKDASGILESKEAVTLIENHSYLLEELIDNDLVSILFQEKIISFLDKCEIQDQLSRKDRVDRMMDKVISKCPEAYPIFLRALQTEHNHVAEKLKETYNSL